MKRRTFLKAGATAAVEASILKLSDPQHPVIQAVDVATHGMGEMVVVKFDGTNWVIVDNCEIISDGITFPNRPRIPHYG